MCAWISRLEYRLQAERTILTRVNAVLQTARSAPVAHMRLPCTACEKKAASESASLWQQLEALAVHKGLRNLPGLLAGGDVRVPRRLRNAPLGQQACGLHPDLLP